MTRQGALRGEEEQKSREAEERHVDKQARRAKEGREEMTTAHGASSFRNAHLFIYSFSVNMCLVTWGISGLPNNQSSGPLTFGGLGSPKSADLITQGFHCTLKELQ